MIHQIIPLVRMFELFQLRIQFSTKHQDISNLCDTKNQITYDCLFQVRISEEIFRPFSNEMEMLFFFPI